MKRRQKKRIKTKTGAPEIFDGGSNEIKTDFGSVAKLQNFT